MNNVINQAIKETGKKGLRKGKPTNSMEKIKCKCGCGIIINKYSKEGNKLRKDRPRYYVNGGHYLKGRKKPGMRGKNNPMVNLKTRQKMIKSKIGKKLSEEHKIKIGIGNKGKVGWSKGLTKETDERIRKLAEGKEGKPSNKKGKTYEEMYGKEKAKRLREKAGKYIKGKKFEEIYGKEKSLEIRKKIKENNSKYWLGKERLDVAGEKNHSWNGGSSFEPYDSNFNNKFKNSIRKRDNQICMLCGIHREKLKKALCVHHINYDKLLTIPENCIVLCLKCHINTNYNRDKWIGFFQSILSERYGYKYSEKNEIILEEENGKFT